MNTRFAPILLFAALLLAVFVPIAGAQSAAPTPHSPAHPEAARGARQRPVMEPPDQPQPAPQGDLIRAQRHPEEQRARPVEAARTAPNAAAPTAAQASALAATGSESEPNDAPVQANAIAPGDIIDAVFDPAGDEDYYTFTAVAGDIFRFTVPYSEAWWVSTTLTLYDTDGITHLAYNDWNNYVDAEIVFIFPAAGNYYLKAANYFSEGGSDYSYQLHMVDEGNADTTVIRASSDNLGQGGNSYSYRPAMTPDGRFVAFQSYADNLVPQDWNEASDIFVRDTQTNTIERVSVSSAGDEANKYSYEPTISADGRYVAFYSYADNLIPSDANGTSTDIFVHDRLNHTTTLVSRHTDGTQGNSDSYDPAISADGQFVVFQSYAVNLVDGDANGDTSDIFVRDLINNTTTLVSRHTDGTQPNSGSYEPAISANGQVVAFYSYADNLVDDDDNGVSDIFVRNLSGSTTTLVSRHTDGTQGNNDSYNLALSADGQVVAFYSYADNLVDDDNNAATDIFVRNLSSSTTILISRHTDGTQGNYNSFEPAISADGQFVAFSSYADNLIDNDGNAVSNIFLYNLITGETTLASRSATGEPATWYSYESALSADGKIVAFSSGANNLVPNDSFDQDIFIRYTGVTLHAISGRVTDESDNGLFEMSVRDTSGAAVYTDDNGTYVMTRLLPGNHGIWAWDNYAAYLFPEATIPVTLPPNTAGIDIVGTVNPLQEKWYSPAADAYVDEAKKAANYGKKPTLNVKNAAKDMRSYLRFAVDGLTCAPYYDAYLDLYVRDGGPDGGTIYETSNNWTETGIKANNAPAAGGLLNFINGVSSGDIEVYVGNVNGDGDYSYLIQDGASNLVQYDSREGANSPFLYVRYYESPQRAPDAQYDLSTNSGMAPLTVDFTDWSSGCATSWEWDFGDGATSTQKNPSHTFTEPGYYPVVLTVSNSKGEDRKTQWIEVIEPPDVFDISATGSGKVQGIPFTNADILRYDKSANTWTMIYDGSVRGTPKNISSFSWDGNDLLLGFSANQPIAGLGTATPFDIVRFSPNNPGVFPLGPGTYSWALQGKNQGLSKSVEKIDALYNNNSDWFISTVGVAAVTSPGGPVQAQDEDALLWYDWDGSWADYLVLDGSTITGLNKEDVNGLWYDQLTNDFYITILGAFKLGGVTGNGKSIIRLAWENGTQVPYAVQWLAPGVKFPSNIDAIELSR